MFSKVSIALNRGSKIADKIKLLILAAYSSRPKFRALTGPLMRSLAKGGLINLSLRSNLGEIIISLRLLDFDSDYLSMTELVLDNCYHVSSNKNYDIVIDGGGNTGLFTVLSNKAWPNTPVLYFEPLQMNIDISNKHFALNNSHCQVKKGIISLKAGEVFFYIRNANNSSFDDSEPYSSKISVTSYNLVDELTKRDFSLALIKLDIEGAEVEVIPDLLKRFPGKVLEIVGELHNWPNHLNGLDMRCRENGYLIETYNQDPVCVLFHVYKLP